MKHKQFRKMPVETLEQILKTIRECRLVLRGGKVE